MFSFIRLIFVFLLIVDFRSFEAEAGLFKPSRENICRSVLKTQRQTSYFFSGVQVYTINSIKGITQSLRVEDRPLNLYNGYAHFRSDQVLDGSLSLSQVKARLKAALETQLHYRDQSIPESESNLRTKTIAITLADPKLREVFFQTFGGELEKALREQILATPLSLFIKSIVPFVYSVIFASQFKETELSSLAMLPLAFVLLNGSKGIRDSLPGSHSSGRSIEKLNNFVHSRSPIDGKEYFLFANSAPLGEYNFSEFDPKSLEEQSAEGLNSQLDIINSSMPLTGFSMLDRQTWVHFDLLIEREESGETEVHILLQFTENEPEFPKRNNQNKKEKQSALLWGREPQLVPIPILSDDR